MLLLIIISASLLSLMSHSKFSGNTKQKHHIMTCTVATLTAYTKADPKIAPTSCATT